MDSFSSNPQEHLTRIDMVVLPQSKRRTITKSWSHSKIRVYPSTSCFSIVRYAYNSRGCWSITSSELLLFFHRDNRFYAIIKLTDMLVQWGYWLQINELKTIIIMEFVKKLNKIAGSIAIKTIIISVVSLYHHNLCIKIVLVLILLPIFHEAQILFHIRNHRRWMFSFLETGIMLNFYLILGRLIYSPHYTILTFITYT